MPEMTRAKSTTRLGAVVLCGGKSTRMGISKAELPFGDETMLARVVRRLALVADPIVLDTAPGQTRQKLPAACRFAEDARPDRGPLEALAAGIRAIGADADAVYATSCDVPMLVTDFVLALLDRLGEHDIVVARDGEFHHPLSAIYRIGVLSAIDELLSADRLRPVFLFDAASTVRVPVEELRFADPELQTLRNLNRPEDYIAALAAAGLTPAADVIETLRRARQGE
jgi:molybdopterin-guanine dinucleotide biosynthesis protein A